MDFASTRHCARRDMRLVIYVDRGRPWDVVDGIQDAPCGSTVVVTLAAVLLACKKGFEKRSSTR